MFELTRKRLTHSEAYPHFMSILHHCLQMPCESLERPGNPWLAGGLAAQLSCPGVSRPPLCSRQVSPLPSLQIKEAATLSSTGCCSTGSCSRSSSRVTKGRTPTPLPWKTSTLKMLYECKCSSVTVPYSSLSHTAMFLLLGWTQASIPGAVDLPGLTHPTL